MAALLVPLLALAATGFLFSALVHIVALTGVVPLGGNAVVALHVGVFAIWFPVVVLAIRISQGQRGFMSWGVLLSGCPVWFRGFLLVLFAYAFLNFFLAFNGEAGHKQQGDALAPATLRGSSGHWMLFYAAGFGVLLTAYRLPWMLRGATCPRGHRVLRDAQSCPMCGAALPGPPRTRPLV